MGRGGVEEAADKRLALRPLLVEAGDHRMRLDATLRLQVVHGGTPSFPGSYLGHGLDNGNPGW